MERIEFNGWPNCVRLSDGRVEVVATTDIGPRIMRYAFPGGPNIFKEVAGEQGGSGEIDWKIRGGHRLWISPERKPLTYEPDNIPIDVLETASGIKLSQSKGGLSGVAKTMEIRLCDGQGGLTIDHSLTNEGDRSIDLAPWAITVLKEGGSAVIPLPPKAPHSERLTHNQEWSIWPYTDFSDDRWSFGSKFVVLRQDGKKLPTKMGFAHDGWACYCVGKHMFVKRFSRQEAACYPDGGVNLEAFANEDFLELESLGSLTSLQPGQTVSHRERWELHELSAEFDPNASEKEIESVIVPATE